ncbi:hypothetical protein EVJ58_g531 [Rhodofomes roseus]|uniref:Integrase-like protein n=1 Tax=Rhodofomes roseus TaxID=34475 RepID=A0A4Y9Z790_9APHY|nr:hypothetical protein EVJ58_g531 [Rhodofomes roseus]
MNHDHVYRRFGLARKFISDRGPQFASKVMGELCRLTGIERALSTAYHPQTDGQMERANQELEIFLRIFCANNPETWDEMLPDAEFAHNSRPHSAIKMSPFYAMMGYEPRGIPHITEVADSPTTEERLKRLQKAREEAAFALEAAQQVIEKRIKDCIPAFKKDQQVWLNTQHLHLPYAARKLAPKKEGPFKITEVMGRAMYRLQLPPQWQIHPVFHAGLLSPYNETEEHGPTYTEPPPDKVDGENSWEFEAILGHKGMASQHRYLIKWKGYPPSENSWEPKDVFLGTGEETLDESQLQATSPTRPPLPQVPPMPLPSQDQRPQRLVQTYISASTEAGLFDQTTPAAPASLFDSLLRCCPLPGGHLNWPLASQVLSAPNAFVAALEHNGSLSNDPSVALDALDSLVDLYNATADDWVQQNLMEDAVHLYAERRNALARRLMCRFKDLEDHPAIKSVARSLIPVNDIQYTCNFVVSPTFTNINA